MLTFLHQGKKASGVLGAKPLLFNFILRIGNKMHYKRVTQATRYGRLFFSHSSIPTVNKGFQNAFKKIIRFFEKMSCFLRNKQDKLIIFVPNNTNESI